MERDHGWTGFVRHSVAVLLLLCSFALNSTCFSLPKATGTVEPEEDRSVAEVLERRTGRILFNGKELENQPSSAAAAAEDEEMIPVDLYQPDSTETPQQTPQLEAEATDEAAWRLLNASLFCDQIKGTLEASGPAATDLQVLMGDGNPQPLIQVALTCGYSMQQDSHGLVLEVPFAGCGVVHKDEGYVLPMIWRKTPVELTCPVLTTPDSTPAPTVSELDQEQSGDGPDQDRPWSSARSRRHVEPALSPFDPRSPYYYPSLYSYYSYMSSLVQNAAPSTDVATVNPKPVPQTPVQTNYKPHQYSQDPYYTYDPYYNYQTSVGYDFGTHVANDQYHQQYYQSYHYPYGYPAVQPEYPENQDVYYYPAMQHYYGQKPHKLTTTKAPTTTTRHPCTAYKCTTTTTRAPCTTTTTRAPCTTTTTRAPCTAAPCTTTTTTKPPCTATTCSKPRTTPASRCYPGRNCPFVSYGREPFKPIVSYARSLKIPDKQDYAPDAGYQSEVVPPMEMQHGHQWESVPWFPQSADQGDSPFDWKSLQPRQA